jgi:hypothetical protein
VLPPVDVFGFTTVVPTPLFKPPFGATAAPLLLDIEPFVVYPAPPGCAAPGAGVLFCWAIATPEIMNSPAVAVRIVRIVRSWLLGPSFGRSHNRTAKSPDSSFFGRG